MPRLSSEPDIILYDSGRHLHRGYSVDIEYLDFEKAFDRIPHQGLLSKLSSRGIRLVDGLVNG